jgi:sarcosine oxidase subunit beta
MTDRPRVIVVGAGVIGAAIAYHLGLEGCEVHCLGRTSAPQPPTASWASAGGLKFQRVQSDLALLTLKSSRRWPRLPEELRTDLGLRLWGSLDLAITEADVPRLQTQMESDRAHGIQVEMLSGGDFAEVGAPVGPLVPAGTFVANGGQADPRSTTRAFLQAGSRRGVSTTAVEVIDLILETGRVRGVITDTGRMEADLVVVAAGHWSASLVRMAGIELPLRPAGAHMLQSRPVTARLYPTISAVGRLLSVKQLTSREILIGGGWPATVQADGLTCLTRPESVERNLVNAATVVPWTERLQMERSWCGIDGETPDHLPLIGPLAGMPSLYLATGFSLGGFQLAPGVGEMVAAEVARALPQPALARVRPGRFDELVDSQIRGFQQSQRDTPPR